MTIGEKIKKVRKEKKITQKALATDTGIAEITIRQYEAGKYKPKIEQLQKIADALDIAVGYLLEGEKFSLTDKDAVNAWQEILKQRYGPQKAEVLANREMLDDIKQAKALLEKIEEKIKYIPAEGFFKDVPFKKEPDPSTPQD